MEASTINAIIAGIIGLITGAVGSLVAPWVNWGIEKKRQRNERRIELIEKWREIISTDDFDRSQLLNNAAYGPLSELLTDKVRIDLEGNHIVIVLDIMKRDYYRDILLREIARIEKSWKLI